MTVIYDTTFNWNEWFIILTLLTMSVMIWVMPKIFSVTEGIAFFVFGVFAGMLFDHTISVEPWDLYDVNDDSSYQVMDFLSYVMYGPFSYFFAYIYKRLHIQGFFHIGFILVWSLFAFLLEWIAVKIGLFHFDKGYPMYWSIPIYMTTQSLLVIYYHVIRIQRLSNRQSGWNS
ncbi:hypothetical protein GMD78_06065 [Ornithinibacillus sp. L9]|uniref:Uncharacterized protein n=1 Tax=Ornithinibacillus caprae TaxID=2678566 RepID=A0A6N8FE61_9BACI|nr:hypothetical protein [Ornithinibacillus caprae]MUK87962.1 hypothetical protein [Ornithinibacillus caprae]